MSDLMTQVYIHFFGGTKSWSFEDYLLEIAKVIQPNPGSNPVNPESDPVHLRVQPSPTHLQRTCTACASIGVLDDWSDYVDKQRFNSNSSPSTSSICLSTPSTRLSTSSTCSWTLSTCAFLLNKLNLFKFPLINCIVF